MASQKRSKLHYVTLWLTGIFGVIIICSIAAFTLYLSQINKARQNQLEAKTKAVKGQVWYERANKAHDRNNHDEEFELLRKSANLDYVPAILKMSQNYETGHNVEKSDLKSQEWAAKLPQNQYIQFLYRRGYALTETGQTVEQIGQGLEFLESVIQISPDNHTKDSTLHRIGTIYSKGPESLRDKAKAHQIFETIGGLSFGNFLSIEGLEAEQAGEHIRARQLYQQAIDAGSINAKVRLAYSYSNDVDSQNSEERVTELIAEVLQSDEPQSRHQAAIYSIERGSAGDEVLGLEAMEELADSGFERSSLYLIDYYSDNPNIEADYDKVAHYIQKLTYMSTKTKVTLAHLKRTGTAMTQDEKAAFKLYEDAASYDYIPAKMALAHMHRLGIGTPKDSEKAKALYLAARYDDRHPASFYIGLMYENGELGIVDMERAITLYELAAQSEYGPALMRLAKLHEIGNHIPQNKEKAFKLMTEAAYTGHTEAIENLARYYSEGIRTELNSEYAAIWRGKKEPRPVLGFPS